MEEIQSKKAQSHVQGSLLMFSISTKNLKFQLGKFHVGWYVVMELLAEIKSMIIFINHSTD